MTLDPRTMSAPASNPLAVVYQPKPIAVHDDCFVVRGFGPLGNAGYLQEGATYRR